MMGNYRVRTDLAVESKEKFERDQTEIPGVKIQTSCKEELHLQTTVVEIETERGARAMEKPKGTYITMEARNLVLPDEDYHREISCEIARHLRNLVPKEKSCSVLVAGLGNREITPDALGPWVVQNLRITRHLVKKFGSSDVENGFVVSSLVPGVMAQTGMETMEILQGVIRETRPDVVIAIDALAARSMRRLNCTIQITDTGISPGSGVLNYRNGLNRESLGVPVIGIGVPTVVDAATIVHDAVAHLLENLEEAEMEEFLGEVIQPRLYSMFVTPKDVDETVKLLSYTISEGINIAFSE